ncbi:MULTISPECIES: type IV pilin [unclassified Halorhabdus]|uniref:type IV pilin n=1 Tax=unclassified Halorhabdus TaxID=2621901 RepID=UPI0023DB82D6|nr:MULTISPECIES: type IV pilin [unclassified Halorhabdus]WEL16387.1 Pilin/Flagellin, FlaG/FlaF family [Halorhabdus sp. SVX81]WEL20273.1 Pilin/Flagellin, FlaG/FlaF family [Halorhabdus sp. BNX81]
MVDRAVSPVVGIVLVVALTVLLAATVGTMALGTTTPDPGATVQLSANADAASDAVALTHEGGDALDPAAIDVNIAIDGTDLTHQPPVPFFAATGFVSGPTGAFNSKTTGPWTAGETARLELASTNNPLLTDGATVTVTVTEETNVLARLETTAE